MEMNEINEKSRTNLMNQITLYFVCINKYVFYNLFYDSLYFEYKRDVKKFFSNSKLNAPNW